MNCQASPLLPEILALHGKWRGSDPALLCGDLVWTWEEMMATAHRLAHGLRSRGIDSGDRVGVVMSNSPAMVQALLGIMAGGAVSVPINLSVADEALCGMMHNAGVSAIVTTDDQRPRVDAMRSRLPASCKLLINDGVAGEAWASIAQLCDGQPAHLPAIDLQDDDLLNIIYSSGTTALPKGIAHSHRARRDWAYDLCIALRYHCSSKTLLTIGLYSNISWVGMLCTLLAGGTLVVHESFDAARFLECVQQQQITHSAMVPLQYQRLVDRLETAHYDTSSMQAMMCCGSPLHVDLKKALFEKFDCGIIELYGLTEGIITTLEPEAASGRLASVGKPLIGTDIMILGEQNAVLPAGESGEVLSLGRIAMAGYFQNPEATREASYTDEQGRVWLRSGDIGYLDRDNYLYIVDRKKDMILSGGQNIYPQDIEAILKKHPDVYDAAVIGVKSKRWGETPLGLVVPSRPDVEAESLLAWANQLLGRQQRMADLILVQELPRNPNGKLLKRELRKEFEETCYE